MADRPIIFSTSEVRALLDGRKTQTRQVLKPQPGARGAEWHEDFEGGTFLSLHCPTREKASLPYAPGDRLWCREVWAHHHPAGVQAGRMSIPGTAGIPGPPSVKYRVIYRADGEPLRVWHCDGYPYRTIAGPRDAVSAKYPDVCSEFPGWLSPIHMPRWASRLTLVVTDVRVQRVQEISEADAKAEGIEAREITDLDGANPETWWFSGPCSNGWRSAKSAFRDLWNATHGPGAWDANPWVAALTFEVRHCNIDQMEPRHD